MAVEDGPALTALIMAYFRPPNGFNYYKKEGEKPSSDKNKKRGKCKNAHPQWNIMETCHSAFTPLTNPNGVFLRCKKTTTKQTTIYRMFKGVKDFMCPGKKTYHRSSSPVSACIRASTRIRRLKQNERLSLRPRRQRG